MSVNIDYVSGLTPGEISRMSAVEIHNLLQYSRKRANERLHRLGKAGLDIISPEYGLVKAGGKRGQGLISGRKQSRGAMIRELMRAQGILRAKTSTVKGVRAFKKGVEDRLGYSLTNEQFKELFSKYDEFKNSHYAWFAQYGSERLQKLIASEVQKGDVSIDDLLSVVKADYKSNKKNKENKKC